MNSTTVALQILTLLVALFSAAAAWSAFVRAGRWRDTDDGKQVKEDIHGINNAITKINGRLDRAEQNDEGLPALVERVAKVETAMESLASAGDFRELKAEVAGINRSMNNIQSATTRIETYLRESGR
jgi:hypothetical protein